MRELTTPIVSGFVEPVGAGPLVSLAALHYRGDVDARVPIELVHWDIQTGQVASVTRVGPIPKAGLTTLQAAIGRLGSDRLIVAAGNRGYNSGGPVFLGVTNEHGAPVAPYRTLSEWGGAPVVASDGQLVAVAWVVGDDVSRIEVATVNADGSFSGRTSFVPDEGMILSDYRAVGLAVVEGKVYIAKPTSGVVVQAYDRALTPLGRPLEVHPRREEEMWGITPVGLLSRASPDLVLSTAGTARMLSLDLTERGEFDVPGVEEVSEIAQLPDGRMATSAGFCSRITTGFSRCFETENFRVGPSEGSRGSNTCHAPLLRTAIRAVGNRIVHYAHCDGTTRITVLE